VSGRTAIGTPGVRAALAAALLFGLAAPLSSKLLGAIDPWMLAALLYLGSGVGLTILRRAQRAPAARLPRRDVPWLAGAVVSGGVVGPVLLMHGLTGMPASAASLLLNAEVVLTAALAWAVFRENLGPRVGLGMAAVVAGAVVLGWPGQVDMSAALPALAVVGACLAWALDNNLTRRVSLADATWVASVKGLVAGTVNLVLALVVVGARVPAWSDVLAASVLGLASYGVSLSLFVVALRHLGSARTGAYFGVAPFAGAAVAVGMGDPMTGRLLAAGGLMGVGVWLQLSERHDHVHTHGDFVHDHHVADDGHHDPDATGRVGPHHHPTITHSHPHYPDSHHRHRHPQ
jgi:drug/metabolite transporter (DMT)-like permease